MKKIMVVSDTHKHHRNLARALEQAGTPDLLIHLGDAEGYEDYIADMAGCPLEIVSGNNDFFSMLDKEKEIRIGKYKVLLTHGHYYYVSAGLDTLRKEAYSRGMDIVMFGHTHRPLIEYDKELTVINPGSLSYPRLYAMLCEYVKEKEYKNGYVMWPIRTAVSGKQMTPGGATELMEVLGKEESISRIKAAIEKLEKEL